MKCVPWLASEAGACRPLDLVPTSAAMTAPVVTATERMRLDTIRSLLRDTRHNGFPVVRDTPAGQVSYASLAPSHPSRFFPNPLPSPSPCPNLFAEPTEGPQGNIVKPIRAGNETDYGWDSCFSRETQSVF